MPRRARIDAPGALHHIICLRIERRKIFWQDSDREDFIQRLETILGATETACYAWALLPNHFHLLLRTGNTPIAQLMRQLLSGYAGRFNRLHRGGAAGICFKIATNPFSVKKSRTCWSSCATFI